MSYKNPTILTIASPTGLDTAIESIRIALASISWLSKSFGRAWEFKEERDGKILIIPKVFIGTNTNANEGEYMNVLPNDFLNAQSFIHCSGPEKWDTFNRHDGSMKSREIAIIFWVNLKQIDSTKGYIFTEELKADVEEILKTNSYVGTIDEYYDENAKDIFRGWSIDEVGQQYLMYPYAGFRFNLTINYPEVCLS